MQRMMSWMLSLALLSTSAMTDAAGAAPTRTKTVAATETTSSTADAIEKLTSDSSSGITEYRLKSNGMQILLAEKHTTPVVAVMVVYHVGSRNEAVGYTGSTHFLEHMMFRGTEKHDPLKKTGIDDILKPIGGSNNATTFYDRTNYFELVPAEYLDVCLELEADRMRNALLRESDRTSEMTVVRNELERNEDDPSRLLDVNLFAMAFREHPYHHPVIGWRSDVEGVPIERLRQFYNDFYYPNNATLVVIGDFQSQEALDSINKYFGKVPAAPKPFPKVYTTEPAQQGERRFVVQRGEDLPKVMIGYHIPKATDPDTYALEIAASILGDNSRQSSRLYKALIDTSMASDCYAYNYSLKDPGLFTGMATATPGTPSEKIEKTLEDQFKELATRPISDAELEKAKKSVWKRIKLNAADPYGLASQLAEAIAVADWKWWSTLEKNIKAVTAADVQRVAAKYFTEKNETVGYYYPNPKKPEEKKDASTSSGILDLPDMNVVAQAYSIQNKLSAEQTDDTAPVKPETEGKTAPEPEDSTKDRAPDADDSRPGFTTTSTSGAAITPVAKTSKRASIAAQVKKKVLPNGLTILAMPIKGGVVAVSGKIRSGDYFRPKNAAAVPDLVSEMLTKGSTNYSKEALAQALENLGASLDFSVANFWMDFDTEVVSEDLPAYIPLLADVLKNPKFADDELAKSKKQLDAQIRENMVDTGHVAWNAIYKSVYKPGCVYYEAPFNEQLKELETINATMLKDFHKKYITPANTVIAVVGDIEPTAAFALVEKHLGNWTKGPASQINVSDCAVSGVTARRINSPLSDKTNVDVIMATPASISIKSPDFYAASVANSALGHDTISSRLAELRNKHGLTYGIGSFFTENAFENGLWAIDFSVNPDNITKAIPVVENIVSGYAKDGITPKELQEETKRLAGEYVVERMRTPRHIADAISRYELLGLGAVFMDNYPNKVKAVTLEEANAAIKKYFANKPMITSVAGSLTAPAKAETPAR
jgi:zinc protease